MTTARSSWTARRSWRTGAASARSTRGSPTRPRRSGGSPGPGSRTACRARRCWRSMRGSRTRGPTRGRTRHSSRSGDRAGACSSCRGGPRDLHARDAPGRRDGARPRRGPSRHELHAFLDGRRMTYSEAGHTLGTHPNALRYAGATGTVLIRWDGARQPEVWSVPRPDDLAVGGAARARASVPARRRARSPPRASPGGPASTRAAGRDVFEALASELVPVATPLGDGLRARLRRGGVRAGPRPTPRRPGSCRAAIRTSWPRIASCSCPDPQRATHALAVRAPCGRAG